MVILITGISSGFGKAMAERLSKEGHKVYGTHRRAVDQIPGVNYICADSSDEKQVEAAVSAVLEAEGRIDVFINNAGMGIGGPLEFSSLADAEKQMDINWMGMVRYLHFIVPVMRRQGCGKIICISSIGGLLGLPYQGLYSASKFAIEGYCEALRLELQHFGIKVVVVAPGDFSTGFTAVRKSVTDPEVHKAYPKYAASLAGIEKDENSGLKPEFLAAQISKIIRRKNPRYHYIVSTFLQKLSVIIKPILPPCVFAKIISLYYGL